MDFLKARLDTQTYKIFRKELKMQGRTYAWLASMMGYTYLYTHALLNGKRNLNNNHIEVLNDILEMNVPIK
jgi:hypothetical protein